MKRERVEKSVLLERFRKLQEVQMHLYSQDLLTNAPFIENS